MAWEYVALQWEWNNPEVVTRTVQNGWDIFFDSYGTLCRHQWCKNDSPCFLDFCPEHSKYHRSRIPILEGSYFGWITAKHVPWAEELKKFLARVIETGIYQQSKDRVTEFRWSHCRKDEGGMHPLKVKHLSAGWWVLVLGSGLSVAVFVVENLSRRSSESVKGGKINSWQNRYKEN